MTLRSRSRHLQRLPARFLLHAVIAALVPLTFLVEAHGVRIWVTSDGPGRAATFRFTLPLYRP